MINHNRLLNQQLAAFKSKDNQIFLYKHQAALWRAFLHGPQSSPFQSAILLVQIRIPDQYPIQPPKLFFLTKIFHPNVHPDTGQVCIDIIKSQWTPAWSLYTLCKALIVLLNQPNAESPLNCDAGNLIRSGQGECYRQVARLYARDYGLSKLDFEQKMKSASD